MSSDRIRVGDLFTTDTSARSDMAPDVIYRACSRSTTSVMGEETFCITRGKVQNATKRTFNVRWCKPCGIIELGTMHARLIEFISAEAARLSGQLPPEEVSRPCLPSSFLTGSIESSHVAGCLDNITKSADTSCVIVGDKVFKLH